MENDVYIKYETVLIEWLPNDWQPAIYLDNWFPVDKHLVRLVENSNIQFTVESDQIKKLNETSKFF